MSILNVQKLVKRYPAFELKEVSFSLDNGRITGFIGRNGAGKTTTIKSMLGMIHPDNGTVKYFGKPFLVMKLRSSGVSAIPPEPSRSMTEDRSSYQRARETSSDYRVDSA